ncbi:MAG: hypothetical protein OEQ39_10295 [Gammaproteobacteria bacterium]|nr:hypothetical protein [Gammaproteobacteria bacterium]MDH3465446.1 hypothetical protein [Gammaproteobacteria bacterium]
MQIAYISIRPDILEETLGYVAAFMPFVDEIIIVAPKRLSTDFSAFKDRAAIITDEEILGDGFEKFSERDHQFKNYLLRNRMVAHPSIHDEFIMSDDDARPLKSISVEQFKENGAYNSYYFYDLSQWRYGLGDFDVGQQNTYQALKFLDLPSLSFASHMPQIINKGIFLEAAEKLENIAARYPLCEWSTYFNYATYHYPDLFHDPRPFQTLCWPDCPACWPHYVRPDGYAFENFSAHLYCSGQPFAGIGTSFQSQYADEMAVDKIMRWYRYELNSQSPELVGKTRGFPAGAWRRLLMAILGPIRKLYRLISWEDQARIIEMTGRLESLGRSIKSKDKQSS